MVATQGWYLMNVKVPLAGWLAGFVLAVGWLSGWVLLAGYLLELELLELN